MKMKMRKLCSALLAAAMLVTVSVPTAISPTDTALLAAAEDLSGMPSDYQYAADWIWTNRIEKEQSTVRRNTIFDQIIAGKGTIHYVVKWQSYQTVTYEQRQQFEKMLSDCINAWNDWLAGYENWPYDHIDVKVTGWAVIDKSCLLDLHEDETVYTDLGLMKRLLLGGRDTQEPVDSGEFLTANLARHGASLPSQGDARLVVFYVDFPDCTYDYAPTTEELQKITFGAADAGNANYPFESIPAFYSRASKGSMQFDGQVFRYTTKENAAVYGPDKVKLAEECYEAFKDQVDFSQFDGNKDGKIDATLFTVPTKAGDDDWWPCAGAFGDPEYRVDGVAVGHIITGNAQVESKDSYINYVSSYCHELGHCTGLPDYYLFTSSDSEGMHGSAGIELMDTDAGSDFGAFSKLIEGWYRKGQVQVYHAAQGTQTFTLHNAQTNAGNCVIIPNGTLADDYFSEYFIIEYATRDGNNSGIGSKTGWWTTPGEGIRIYHIDATTEYGWNTYFRYASGSEFTNQDQGRRLIRIIDDTDTDNFYHTGDVINGSISGFHWYDVSGGQTVDTGLTVTVGELVNGSYTITVSGK